MSEKEKEDYINLLKEIFHFSEENPLKIYPIIKESDNIYKFKSYMENNKISNLQKLSLLKQIKQLFLTNQNLIPFFDRKYSSNSSNFYFPIINLFLSEDIKDDSLKFLEELLILLNSNISISKLSLEYIYQKLSKYYIIYENRVLTESLLIRYLNLLQVFYKDNSIKENDIIDIFPQQEGNEILNYIYLNGIGSGINFNLNYNSSYKVCFPSIENGCSFVFWINLDDKILKIYRKLYPNIEINLIKINIREKKIKLVLKETRYLQIIIDEFESSNIDLSSVFQFNKWNIICFKIGKSDRNYIKLYINNVFSYSDISIQKNFPIKEKISEIKCFDNLIGRVSSLLFFSFPLENEIITYLNRKIKYGFYKNKILYKFLHSNNNEYLNNAKNYKYEKELKNEELLIKKLKILSEDKNNNNIICFFCPFAYNKNNNQLDDIFRNYVGILSKDDGVNYFINYSKDLEQVGGINILLPIAEIMLSSNLSNQNISYTLIDKNILSERTLLEFLIIIKNILNSHTKNLYDANNSFFFSSLGLFLEKFPSTIFTEQILDVLLEIGKEIFHAEFDYDSTRNDNYIDMILLNEKILFKFSVENQRKLWDKVYQFFISDYSKIKDSLNIYKIYILLRIYDEKRYKEFCCNEHAQIFLKSKNNLKGKIKIINPNMGKKVAKLFDVIQIYIKN